MSLDIDQEPSPVILQGLTDSPHHLRGMGHVVYAVKCADQVELFAIGN